MALTKCPECGKDVSTHASACPNCGYPISTMQPESTAQTASVVSNPQPDAETLPVRLLSGCLGVIMLCVALGWIANLAGLFGSSGVAPGQAHPLTKAEWRQKLESRGGQQAQLARQNIINHWGANNFKQLMGDPSSTQTLGDEVYWYYECSDGQIQLVLNAGLLLGMGVMEGNINDY